MNTIKNIFKLFLAINLVFSVFLLFFALGNISQNHFIMHKGLNAKILACFILATPIIHVLYYLVCIVLRIKKICPGFKFISFVYLLSLVFLMIWFFITIKLGKNGAYDIIWGPGDTGLVYLSLCYLLVHYLLLSNFLFKRIVSLYTLVNELLYEIIIIISIFLIFK